MSVHIRPRFKQSSKLDMEELQTKIRTLLDAEGAQCTGTMITGHIVLRIPIEDRHFWSPQLSLSLEDLDEPAGGTLIRGLYGPNPTVWALFAFGYSAIGFMALFISIIGFSQKNLGQAAPILWVLPFLFLGVIVLYLVAQAGQRLGADEMRTLHHFYENAVGERVEVH
jgi:hypothetical protein